MKMALLSEKASDTDEDPKLKKREIQSKCTG
jgi:hypothetical protein